MIHFRIIGAIWLLAGVVPAVTHAFELWAVATGRPNSIGGSDHGTGFWISQALVEASFLVVAWMGMGLIRLRHWAAICSRFVGAITIIVMLWFIVFQGQQHGPQPYFASWFGVLFGLYTLFAAWKLRPSQQTLRVNS